MQRKIDCVMLLDMVELSQSKISWFLPKFLSSYKFFNIMILNNPNKHNFFDKLLISEDLANLPAQIKQINIWRGTSPNWKQVVDAVTSKDSLESLKITGCNIIPKDLQSFDRLQSLKSLTINHNNLAEGAALHISRLKNITYLDISQNSIRNQIVQICNLNLLETLIARSNCISDDGMKEIHHLQNLRVLDLTKNQISDKSAPNLYYLQNLQVLDLQSNRIGNATMKWLVRLTKLQQLNLMGNYINDEGLCQITVMNQLKKLIISTLKLSKLMIQSIKKILPTTKIFV